MDVEGKLKLYARFVEENIPTNRRLKAHRLYYRTLEEEQFKRNSFMCIN